MECWKHNYVKCPNLWVSERPVGEWIQAFRLLALGKLMSNAVNVVGHGLDGLQSYLLIYLFTYLHGHNSINAGHVFSNTNMWCKNKETYMFKVKETIRGVGK